MKRLPLLRHYLGMTSDLREIAQDVRWLREFRAEAYVRELLASPRYQDPKRLNRFEHKVFSQSGEDGIIAEIFRRIGETNRFFVEFGVGNGTENNTLHLLVQGWEGRWIEGSEQFAEEITGRCAEYLDSGRLGLRRAFVTAESIESLLASLGVPAEPDLLSIDIDGNDYWVWRAIERYRPRVVVIEYNAVLSPPLSLVQRYEASRSWNRTSYFGASLKALEALGAAKGWNLVGCSLSGANAFFVRSDLCRDHFAAPFTAEHHYEPARYQLIRQLGHAKGFGSFVEV